jgi:hypothetical protein
VANSGAFFGKQALDVHWHKPFTKTLENEKWFEDG